MPGTEKLHAPPEFNDKHPVSFYPNVQQSFPHEVEPCLLDAFAQKPKQLKTYEKGAIGLRIRSPFFEIHRISSNGF